MRARVPTGRSSIVRAADMAMRRTSTSVSVNAKLRKSPSNPPAGMSAAVATRRMFSDPGGGARGKTILRSSVVVSWGGGRPNMANWRSRLTAVREGR